MESTIKKLPNSRIKFQIKATSEEVAKFFDRAVEILAKDVAIKGFRTGKVPKEMAKDALGEHAVEHKAQDLAIQDTYFEMVTREKITPLASPADIKIEKFSEKDGLDWSGEVDVIPSINIEGWKNKLKVKSEKLKIKKEEIKIEEKDTLDVLNNIQKQFAQLADKEEGAEMSDWVNFDLDVANPSDFTPEELKGMQIKNMAVILGESRFIPGFEENLIGITPGLEKEFDNIFPEDYFVKSLSGKKVLFKVKINAVKKMILPNFDDDFAKKFGHNTLVDLKKAINDDLLRQREQEAKNKFEDKVLRIMAEIIDTEVPNSLLVQEKEMMLNRFKHDLEHHKNMNFADYLMSINSTEEKVLEGLTSQAISNVKVGLILGQITKEENIDIVDRDLEELMAMDIIKQTAGLPSDKARDLEDKIKASYRDEQFLSSVKNSIMARKTVDLIMSQVD
ncbi:trigger factor [Candidatus Microgenomates bacterium]|nr:trigger factor [Candidatus Microgenomates bacterium]